MLNEQEQAWAEEQVVNTMAEGDEPNWDNLRIADMDDELEMALFQDAEYNGCCGSYNEEVVHPTTGKRIMIGCNYGH